MAAKKNIVNKVEKAAVDNKVDVSTMDWTAKNYILEAIKDSQHMKKGQVMVGIGCETAKILVERGLVKVV